jgi:hypothetical protein
MSLAQHEFNKCSRRDLHWKVGTTIRFESLEGQITKMADLLEVRSAPGKAEIETTSVDDAVVTLEGRAFFHQGLDRMGSLSITKQRSIRPYMITRHPWIEKMM